MKTRHINRIFLGVVAVVALGAIISGFQAFGSPATRRKINMDQHRLNDLYQLATVVYNIQNNYSVPNYPAPLATDKAGIQTTPLPNSINEFSPVPGSSSFNETNLRDPITKEPYVYQKIDDRTYKLCASFDTVLDKNKYQANMIAVNVLAKPVGSPDIASFWDHPKGHHCFEFSTVAYPQSPPYWAGGFF